MASRACAAVVVAAGLACASGFHNLHVLRDIRVAEPTVRIADRIKAEGGQGAYRYVLPHLVRGRIIRATASQRNATLTSRMTVDGITRILEIGGLRRDGSTGVMAFKVVVLVAGAFQSLPTRIRQGAPHRVIANGSLVMESFYPSADAEARLIPGACKVQSVWTGQGREPARGPSGVLVFKGLGPLAPREARPFGLHLVHPAPFLSVRSSAREVTVGLWGDAHVADALDVANDAAPLAGGFSRAAAKGPGEGIAEVRLALTRGARGAGVRDALGNITTSRVERGADGGDALVVRPRFPLLGGWHSELLVEHRAPAGAVLLADSGTGELVLRVPAWAAVGGATVQSFRLRAVLPLGAEGIDVALPPGGHMRRGDDLARPGFPALPWTTGRTVVVVEGADALPGDAASVEIRFRVPPGSMLRAPLLVFAATLLVLGSAAGCMRLAFMRSQLAKAA